MMMKNKFLFEVCANGVESCLAAQAAGADRVELCASMPEGGTTPSYGEIKVTRQLLTTTRLHVIIRPRGGDFCYTDLEAERMIEDIRMCRELGVDGVVFGCLTQEGDIDQVLCQRLMQECQGLSVTFHRAFDCARHPEEAMEQIIALGFNRILTSGQQPKAIDGTDLLRRLNEQADDRIILLAGSGIDETNIDHIQQVTGIHEFHFSVREPRPCGVDVTTERRVKATINKILNA